VAPAAQGRGLGAELGRALEAEARRRGVKELRTVASWRQHSVLRDLDHAGWTLDRAQVFDCALGDATLGGPREAPVDARRLSPGDANDYSVPQAGRDDVLARDIADVGVLRQDDLEGIARIDRRLTGNDRSAYLSHALAEALTDSAVRVSLAARADGGLAGFLMARVDLGDYGRTDPVAVLDTIGVDPLRAGQGYGRALLSQLFVNLQALGVERIETVVAPGEFGLLRFIHLAGLRPAERLSFVKRL
ncbi:MAG: GNAT family N-acetyltransferase, partial [Pseudomonadota bacterium]